MTPTERRYLLFLSPRTPRPKSADRPGKVVLTRMKDAGWIRLTPTKRDPWQCAITPAGEAALDAAAVVKKSLTADLLQMRAEIEKLEETALVLLDPNAVHVNMLRGTIAKPSLAQIEHLYPEVAAMAAEVARLTAIVNTRNEWFYEPDDPESGYDDIYYLMDHHAYGEIVEVVRAIDAGRTFEVQLDAPPDSAEIWSASCATAEEAAEKVAAELSRRAALGAAP